MASLTGILSSGAKLSYIVSGGQPAALDNLQEVPDLGQVPETVDTTCLADRNKHNIPGLVDYGTLEFGFLYHPTVFSTLKDMEGTDVSWEFELPKSVSTATAGTKFAFSGKPTVIMTGAAVGSALQFKLAITVTSDVTVTVEA